MQLKLWGSFCALLLIAGWQAMPAQQQGTDGTQPRAARTIRVNTAAELQPALDAAEPGDTIELVAGTTYTGNFRLPAKAEDRTEFITLQSTMIDKLPAGVRVTPESADRMAKLVTNNTDPLLVLAPRAHHWRIVGLELTTAPGVYTYDVIRVGEMEATTAAVQPRDIELDRIYLHAHPEKGSKRGIFFNSNAARLTNSYISEFKSDSQDAMAVAVCNGPGPYEISNNYLEGSGYSIIFGGCPNAIPGVVPSDVTFTRNHLFKPLSWQGKWGVKNIFEVKMGRRMRIEGNVFENNWVANQNGFGILFTVRADGVDAQGKPFGVIEDINFTNNLVINTPNGINILGQDDIKQNTGQARRLTFRNNLFLKVTNRLLQTLQSPQDIVFEKNTALAHTTIMFSENTSMGMVMRDNIFALGEYGIFGSGLGSGNAALKANFPDSIVRFNGFFGEGESLHPTGNTYLKKVEDIRFVNLAGNDYRLQSNSPLRGKGQNGKDPGADMDALQAAINGVASVPITKVPPKIAAVVNVLDFTGVVNPGGLALVIGTSLAPCTLLQPTAPLPTTICDTQVVIDGKPAGLLYVSPEQIQAQVPSQALADRNLGVQVMSGGVSSDIYMIESPNVKPVAPAMLSYAVRDSDVIWAAMRHADNTWNGPMGSGAALRPGEKATLLVSGLGPTTPVIPDGYPPPADVAAIPDARVELYINDVFQPIERVAALRNTIGMFELQFTLDGATPIGGLQENWIWINALNVESVRRRVQLAALPPAGSN